MDLEDEDENYKDLLRFLLGMRNTWGMGGLGKYQIFHRSNKSAHSLEEMESEPPPTPITFITLTLPMQSTPQSVKFYNRKERIPNLRTPLADSSKHPSPPSATPASSSVPVGNKPSDRPSFDLFGDILTVARVAEKDSQNIGTEENDPEPASQRSQTLSSLSDGTLCATMEKFEETPLGKKRKNSSPQVVSNVEEQNPRKRAHPVGSIERGVKCFRRNVEIFFDPDFQYDTPASLKKYVDERVYVDKEGTKLSGIDGNMKRYATWNYLDPLLKHHYQDFFKLVKNIYYKRDGDVI